LWWGRAPGASSFVLADQRSSSPVVYSNFTDTCGFCYNYWMARTMGLTGANATTYRANPLNWNFSQGTGLPRVSYSGNPLTVTNSLPAENSYDGATGTRPKKGDVYTFSLYLTTNGTPSLYKTVKKTLLTDLIDPVNGVNMKWNTAGGQTLAALDPASVAVASIPLNWNQTAGAEQIRGVTVSMTDSNDDNTAGIPKGATSVTATAPNGKMFTGIAGALVTGANLTQNGYRDIYFGYRMLDGAGKQSVYSYYQ
jgi:hypothetical protein